MMLTMKDFYVDQRFGLLYLRKWPYLEFPLCEEIGEIHTHVAFGLCADA